MDITNLSKWILDSDALKTLWAYVANFFTPPFPYRFDYDDKVGFRLDENNCPLCPICLNEGKATSGKLKGRRTLICPIHGDVNGTKAVTQKREKRHLIEANNIAVNETDSNNIDGVFELLIKIAKQMTTDWPAELPPENTSGFWKEAARYESALRAVVSRKIELLFDKDDLKVNNWTALETWLYYRRVDFVMNILFEAGRRRVILKDKPRIALRHFLLETWDEYGVQAFWNHAMERDGKPAPDADPVLVNLLNSHRPCTALAGDDFAIEK